MTPLVHRVYIATLAGIVAFATFYLGYKGYSYYSTPFEERFYHPDHDQFKPSGIYGHGLGIVGTLLIIIGVFGYIAKKKYRVLARFGRLKYWLEFHIFLCSLGPVMILYHTAFKFGGLVSVSFWSMVAVVASGVIGRFIYIQIPRTIEGRALSLHEIQSMKGDLQEILKEAYQLAETSNLHHAVAATVSMPQAASGVFPGFIGRFFVEQKALNTAKKLLYAHNLSRSDVRKALKLVKNEITMNKRIERLQVMQKLFKYWHVVHLPFALVMLVIMIIHVGITLAFGYRWIF
jgi:hypothetical protein